jgi:Protein of unknown function (DUF3616)
MCDHRQMFAERRVELRFGHETRATQTHTNLSAVHLEGNCLWAAGDEAARIERLTATTDDQGRFTAFTAHRGFALSDLVALPAGPDAEADIEGLARSAGWLWAVGSHSLKRKKIKSHQSATKARRRLATVEREENRFILARLPLTPGPDGLPEVVRDAADGRTAGLLGGHGDSLTDLLDDDPHLAPFLSIPGKDNGVDIEGIAVRGDRVYVGLRGPVLRGWAVLLELRPGTHPHDPGRLRLLPLDDDAPYRTHFLDLGGLGIRDLCPHGDDLLILTGPSMDLDGPVRLIRWPGAATAEEPEIVPAGAVELLGDLPYGHGDDHAEGIALLDEPGGPRLLVVYDSPAADRHTPEGGILADVVALPG